MSGPRGEVSVDLRRRIIPILVGCEFLKHRFCLRHSAGSKSADIRMPNLNQSEKARYRHGLDRD